MAADPTQSFSIFVPLIFVVVTELSGIVRSEDYGKASGTETDSGGRASSDERDAGRRPILIPNLDSVPSFGRLNAVHAMNLLLLRGSFVLAIALLSGLLRSVLILLVGLVWVSLPLLETDVFATVLADGKLPTSLYFHGLASVLSMAHAVTHVTAAESIQHFDLLELGRVTFSADGTLPLVGGLVLFFVEWFVFLVLLESDVDDDPGRSLLEVLLPTDSE